MKVQRAIGSYTLSLKSTLDGNGWSRRGPGRSTPGKIPDTRYRGEWMGFRAGLNGCGRSLSTGIRSRTSQSVSNISSGGKGGW